MTLKDNNHIEPYLREFRDHRKSSVLKLIAAWDGLSIETQIKILNDFSENGRYNFIIPDQIILKGLESPNDYIRYLIAQRVHPSHHEKISKDKSALVRSSVGSFSQKIFNREVSESGEYSISYKPENFYLLSKEEQILYFSILSLSQGRLIQKIIAWGLENNALTEDSLTSLLNECTHNFNRTETFGHSDSAMIGLEILWRMTSKLGEKNKHLDEDEADPMNANEFLNEIVIDTFILKLPIEIDDKKLSINIINQLDDRTLRNLVQRRYPLLYFGDNGKVLHGEVIEEKLEQKAYPKSSNPSAENLFEYQSPEITWKNVRNTYLFSFFILCPVVTSIPLIFKTTHSWFWLLYSIPILACYEKTVEYIKQVFSKKCDKLIVKISRKIKSEIENPSKCGT